MNDYGCDPLPDGTFKMVPSGDIVSKSEKEQRLNKVNTLIFIHNGHQKTLRDLSKESGLKRDTLYRRLIILKWPIEKAVTFPNRYGFKK